jgi:hypothetical protein
VKTRDAQRGRAVIQRGDGASRAGVGRAAQRAGAPQGERGRHGRERWQRDAVPLAGGLAGLAQLFRDSRKHAKTAQAMARYGLDDAVLQALDTSAAEVRGLAGPYTQQALKVLERALNLQDGRVIVVAEKIVRAFRLAHRSNPCGAAPRAGRARLAAGDAEWWGGGRGRRRGRRRARHGRSACDVAGVDG